MNTSTALRLLGPLASLVVQRRYIVEATGDSYLVPAELVNEGHYFLRHPLLGETGSLPSVQKFGRVLEQVGPRLPLDDSSVSNDALVEQDPDWIRVREAARAVLQEMGADIEEWEREQLASDEACHRR